MFAGDRALFGLDGPLAVWRLGDVRRPATADDPGAQGSGARRHGHGHIRGVHMAVIRRVQRPDHTVQIIERVERGNTVGPHQFNVEPEAAPDRQRVPQPVHFILVISQPE